MRIYHEALSADHVSILNQTARLWERQVEYTYDVFDRRIGKDIDEEGDGVWNDQERYIYDGSDIVAQYNTDTSGNFQLTHRYLHGPAVDQILADEQYLTTEDPGTIAGNVLYPLVDNLGTVRDIADFGDHDSNGGTPDTTEVVNHLTYSSYGEIIDESDNTIKIIYAYTSRERDYESDLQHNGERYYDAAIAQWTSEDNKVFGAGDANLRRYVENGATNYTDPDGREKNPDGQKKKRKGTKIVRLTPEKRAANKLRDKREFDEYKRRDKRSPKVRNFKPFVMNKTAKGESGADYQPLIKRTFENRINKYRKDKIKLPVKGTKGTDNAPRDEGWHYSIHGGEATRKAHGSVGWIIAWRITAKRDGSAGINKKGVKCSYWTAVETKIYTMPFLIHRSDTPTFNEEWLRVEPEDGGSFYLPSPQGTYLHELWHLHSPFMSPSTAKQYGDKYKTQQESIMKKWDKILDDPNNKERKIYMYTNRNKGLVRGLKSAFDPFKNSLKGPRKEMNKPGCLGKPIATKEEFLNELRGVFNNHYLLRVQEWACF